MAPSGTSRDLAGPAQVDSAEETAATVLVGKPAPVDVDHAVIELRPRGGTLERPLVLERRSIPVADPLDDGGLSLAHADT